MNTLVMLWPKGFAAAGSIVTTTADAGLLGADDFSTSPSRWHKTASSLLTTTTSYASTTRALGIAYCHQQSRSVGEIIRVLELIWEALEPHEMRDRVEFV